MVIEFFCYIADQDYKDKILVGFNSQKEESKDMELQLTQATNNDFLHNEIFVPTLLEKSDKVKEQEKTLKTLQTQKSFSRYLEAYGDCV